MQAAVLGRELDDGAGGQVDVAVDPGEERSDAGNLAEQVGVRAQPLHHLQLRAHAGHAGRGERQVLGADAELDRPRRGRPERTVAEPQPAALGGAGDEVHGRRADEAGDEAVRRAVVEVHRAADLLDQAAVHHHDPVGERHRLHLVVGDVDRRGAEPLVQPGDLEAHLHPQRRVEVGERLVEQERLRLAHQRPPHRHPLALPARERLGQPVEQPRQPQRLGGLADGADALGLGAAGDLHREAHVAGDRHVRVERVGLEHHRDVAVARGDVVHPPPADGELARTDRLEAGDHAQQGGLAAARRPDQHDELPVRHLEVDVAQHLGAAVGLRDAGKSHVRHGLTPSPRRR
ncbi:hypothetical protein OG2516_13691 [Oceanicola granulosus HTCC2516]|uniref:Uncharacterized protein n=1 Tax=Oceanicola granulosus (strain ATCC BAA-861 / DSM 15982 / KCTC 12143 / HTCC2516) TaxID=314256 RepID=Q2CE09_OCEGH|nr:hypothetical protein OG2516_13691 [Oceanicola granulosus HTCC2516]